MLGNMPAQYQGAVRNAMPPSRAMAGSGVAHRNRKIKNTRLKETLGLTLTYPDEAIGIVRAARRTGIQLRRTSRI